MGCTKSKIKAIHLAPESPEPEARNGKSSGGISTISDSIGNGSAKLGQSGNGQTFLREDDMLPNRLLAAIPVSDLGDSLDSR